MRVHYEDLERQSGVRPVELDGPACPDGMQYLWGWFCELSNARGGGFGLAPLGWGEIDAWCRVSVRTLLPFERQAVAALDHRYMEIMTPAKKAKP